MHPAPIYNIWVYIWVAVSAMLNTSSYNYNLLKCSNASIPWHHSRQDSRSPPSVPWERPPPRDCPSPTRTGRSSALVCRDGRVPWAIPDCSHWNAHQAIPLEVHPRTSRQNGGGYLLVFCEDVPMSGSSQYCNTCCTGSSHVTKCSWVHLGHTADKGSFPPSQFLWPAYCCSVDEKSPQLAPFRFQMLNNNLCWDLPFVPWVSAGFRFVRSSSENHPFPSAEYRLVTVASWLTFDLYRQTTWQSTCWCNLKIDR